MFNIQIPADILAWLEHNKRCSQIDLYNSLTTAGHPADKSKFWIESFFTNLSAKETQAAELANHFFPQEDFGPHFPNALKSSDLGLHPIGLVYGRPRILHVHNVLTHAECDELVEASRPKLEPSTVVSDSGNDNRTVDTSSRSSYGTYFNKGATNLVSTIEKRLSELFRFPIDNGEPLQILNYGLGAQYKPHFDYFDTNTAGGKANVGKAGNRVATIIMYLNDVDLGGATIFPDVGLSVLPLKGSAVYFDYMMPNGALDALSLHGGAPVQEGSKWIATKWVRQLPY